VYFHSRSRRWFRREDVSQSLGSSLGRQAGRRRRVLGMIAVDEVEEVVEGDGAGGWVA
jgi:hypothetical protein